MQPTDAANSIPSPETARGEIEIAQDAAITIGEALVIAASVPFPLGKSTLQRWAKHWAEQGSASPVKCVLVTSRLGASYRIDRDDFEAWAFDQAQNEKPREAPQDLARPHETQEDPPRPHETLRDTKRPQETSQGAERDGDPELTARIKELEDENLQLRIDVGVRKELITRANDEMQRLHKTRDVLLRENGALHYQLAQLEAPEPRKTIGAPPSADESETARPPEDAQEIVTSYHDAGQRSRTYDA